MPVHKYRTLDEARRALWLRPGDPRIPRQARLLMEFTRRLVVVHAPAGVRKFRTVEEANADRATWVVETLARPRNGEPPSA